MLLLTMVPASARSLHAGQKNVVELLKASISLSLIFKHSGWNHSRQRSHDTYVLLHPKKWETTPQSKGSLPQEQRVDVNIKINHE